MNQISSHIPESGRDFSYLQPEGELGDEKSDDSPVGDIERIDPDDSIGSINRLLALNFEFDPGAYLTHDQREELRKIALSKSESPVMTEVGLDRELQAMTPEKALARLARYNQNMFRRNNITRVLTAIDLFSEDLPDEQRREMQSYSDRIHEALKAPADKFDIQDPDKPYTFAPDDYKITPGEAVGLSQEALRKLMQYNLEHQEILKAA